MSENGSNEAVERLIDTPDADPALRAMLLAAERDLPSVDAERIVAGVTVGGGGGGASGPTPLTWALLVGGSLAAGALISLMLGRTEPAPRTPVSAPAARVEAAPEGVESAPANPDPDPVVDPEPASVGVNPSVRRRAPRTAPGADNATVEDTTADDAIDDALDDAVGEGTLLLRARRALARNDTEAALNAVNTHQQRYPRGRLSLEREAIAVDALSRAGERPEARSRARALLRRWPNSPYTQAAREVLDDEAVPGPT